MWYGKLVVSVPLFDQQINNLKDNTFLPPLKSIILQQ